MLNKKKLLLIFILCIFLLIGILVFKGTHKVEKRQDNIVKEKKEICKKPNGKASSILFYKSDENMVFVKQGDTDNYSDDPNYKLKGTYLCNSKDCTFNKFYEDINSVFIKDDNYVLYNYNKNCYEVLDIPNEQYRDIEVFYYGNKTYLYILTDLSGKKAIYSLKSKKMSSFLNIDILTKNNSYLIKKGHLIVYKKDEETYYVIDIDTFENKFSSKKKISYIENKNNVFYYKNYSDSSILAEIYNVNFKKIIKEKYNHLGVSDRGNLVVSNDNTFLIYNNKGQLIKKSRKYNDILLIVNDYVVVKDSDDVIKLTDYDGNILCDFYTDADDYEVYLSLSGIRNNLKTEVYLTVHSNSKNETYEYYYIPDTKKHGVNVIE